MTTAPTPAVRKRRRIPIVPLVIVAAFFVGMFGASRLSTMLSSDAIPWGLSPGVGGPRFDPAETQTMTVVNLEIWWPDCVELRDYSWLTPEVAFGPSSVMITLRTNDAYARMCPESTASGDPAVVGIYLSPLTFPVRLSEPLGGRALFDGSTFPATERTSTP